MKVAIYAAASNNLDPKYIDCAKEVAKHLAKRGHSLIYGAGSTGLMGAVAEGFREEKGYITGIVPQFFEDNSIEPLCDYCDTIIYTEDMTSRKSIITSNADAFIVMPGGIGTYDELFETIALQQLNVINKPIAILNMFGFYEKLNEFLQYSRQEHFLRKSTLTLWQSFSETQIDEMIAYLEADKEEQGEVVNDY